MIVPSPIKHATNRIVTTVGLTKSSDSASPIALYIRVDASVLGGLDSACLLRTRRSKDGQDSLCDNASAVVPLTATRLLGHGNETNRSKLVEAEGVALRYLSQR